MNERIKELLYEAGGQYAGEDTMTGETKMHTDGVDYEKFAELIVQECIQVMDATAKEAWDNCTYMREEVPTAAHQIAIRKHFGVK